MLSNFTILINRKFVEHGEYEKAYYGTSLGAIRSVVNSEKICVLNLHPQVGSMSPFSSFYFVIVVLNFLKARIS